MTLVFKQKISQGSHLEMYDFPYPKSLIKNNKYIGEIGMTLAYLPPLDPKYGQEYCRTNIDVSFGTYSYLQNGKIDYKGQVPLEAKWDVNMKPTSSRPLSSFATDGSTAACMES